MSGSERHDTPPHEPPAPGEHRLDKDIDAGFDAIRPGTGLAHEQMRARLKQKLFGAPQQPVRLGRFVILDRLGQGGMGVVYSAYDPELDRRVALKLLRVGRDSGSEKARQRLLREAQALARLSHPNVVPIYDVGLLPGREGSPRGAQPPEAPDRRSSPEDQVFIVMEFVVGQTLRAWVEAEERPWSQVLAMYRQAGQGLAAAHAQGLIHRDFKPDNVQVGDDGRVRVLDFGLARGRYGNEIGQPFDSGEMVSAVDSTWSMSKDPSNPDIASIDKPVIGDIGKHDVKNTDIGNADTPGADTGPNKRLNTPLTATGALIGTPAYMSPEQFSTANIGAASDQFSFCLSLYEGLHGQRAFAGDTVGELRRNMDAGRVRPPPRTSGVPGWIHPILCRGLSADPAQRFPSMDRLLAELGRDRARARRRLALAALVLGLIVTTAYSIVQARRTRAADVCAGAKNELAEIWNHDRRAAVERALRATGRPYAERAWPRVAGGIDSYAGNWADMRDSACRAHQRGEQSGDLLDKRMLCLDRRRGALDSAIAVLLETDATSLEHSVDVVQKLPPIDYCASIEALSAEVPPPEDPDIARQVEAVRDRLSRARALEDAGRYGDALTLAETVVASARSLGYQPLLAEAHLVQGRITMARGGNAIEQAIEPLHQATIEGLATGMNHVGLEALARRIYAEGISTRSQRDVLDSLYIAEALLDSMADASFVRALLLNNAGAVYMARDQRDKARAFFERAEQVRTRASSGTIELTIVPLNLALVTAEPEKRAALITSALEILDTELGPDHPESLARRLMASGYLLDPDAARRSLEQTCDRLERYHPDLHDRLASCLFSLALLEADEADTADERALVSRHFLRAAEVSQAAPNAYNQWLTELSRGYGHLHGGDVDAALTALTNARAALPHDSEHLWKKKQIAEAWLAQGLAQLARNRHDDAVPVLEHALSLFTQSLEQNHKVETRRRLARAQISLATALWSARAGRGPARDRARARAIELMAQAEDWYREAGAGYERHLHELARWSQKRGIAPGHTPQP